MWSSIQKIVSSKIKGFGFQEAMDLRMIEKDWENFLPAVLGRAWANKTKPAGLKKGVLQIKCVNSVWVNELNLKQELVFKKIKKRFGQIKAIRVSN